ncbi:MAG: diguanylate cyclase [Candidatus Polarisedimenticolia bacterium]
MRTPAQAAVLLDKARKEISGVVWHVAGDSARQACALATSRPDIPFIALLPASARMPARGAAFRATVSAPVSARLLADLVKREARLMRLEARLSEARAISRARSRRLSVLLQISRAANTVLEPRKVMEIVMSHAQALIRTEAWALLLLDDKDQTLSFQLTTGGRMAAMRAHRVRLGEGIPGWVAQHKRPVVIHDVRKDRRFDPRFDRMLNFTTRSVLCTPLISRGRIIGAVELINKRRGRFTTEDLAMVTTLVEPGAIAIENAILYQKSAELTVTDDLTKLFNSRYLNVHLKREIKRSRRYEMPVSLIFLDLDGFKKVNDSHGHLAGSRALYEVGQVLQETVREIDVVSRYGGDEFTIILPQTGAEGAMVIADRIRMALEERIFLADLGLAVRLTASFGVSTFPDHGQSREELIQGADQAMYLVKDRGKNGVALALQATASEKGRVQTWECT